MSIEIIILIIVLLLLANGVLAMAEIAMISAHKVRLKHRAQEGDKRARAALKLVSAPARFLSTIQVGITLVGIVAGVFGGAKISERLIPTFKNIPLLAPYAEPLALGIVAVGLAYLALIIGELVPKNIALSHPERIAIVLARPMQLLAGVAHPVVSFLTFSTNVVMKILGIKAKKETGLTEEELRHMIEQATHEGVLVKTEKEIVERALLLGDRQVKAFMTPRTEILFLDMEDHPNILWKKITESKDPFFLVCKGSLDEIVGILTKERLLSHSTLDATIKLDAMVAPPLFVPEGVSALRVLDLMKNTRQSYAVVMDEYGGISGLVTFDDFISAILFGFGYQKDEDEPMAVKRDDGSWLLSGMMPMEEFKTLFGLQQLGDDPLGDYDTLGGYVMTSLGKVPDVADHFERDGLKVEVVDMDGRRVDKVLVMQLPPQHPPESPAEEDEGK